MDEKDLIIIFATAPKHETALHIARQLVDRKLVACVNIIEGITSVYRWEARICEDKEVLMKIKTRSEKIEQVKEMINQLHPYAVPEIIAIPTASVAEPYRKWVFDSTTCASFSL